MLCQVEALALEDPKASADLAGMPTKEMQQLAKRYAAADYGVALQGGWRDGRTRLEKLQESLRVRQASNHTRLVLFLRSRWSPWLPSLKGAGLRVRAL